MTPIWVARLRCVGIELYCIALKVAGSVPAIVAMMLANALIAFADLWVTEHDRVMKCRDEAMKRLAELVSTEE